jgi:hypothetical protein
MGKKKANKLARGYATTSVVSKRGPSKDLYESGKTSRKVQVSVKAQSELADLLDELKLRYASSNSPKGLQPNPIDVSPDNKRFLKKVINLVRYLCIITVWIESHHSIIFFICMLV